MVANRRKVSFWPDGSTSPGNYGWPTIHAHARTHKLWSNCIYLAGSDVLTAVVMKSCAMCFGV
jgi:hypothetical protein